MHRQLLDLPCVGYRFAQLFMESGKGSSATSTQVIWLCLLLSLSSELQVVVGGLTDSRGSIVVGLW